MGRRRVARACGRGEVWQIQGHLAGVVMLLQDNSHVLGHGERSSLLHVNERRRGMRGSEKAAPTTEPA